MKRGASGLAGVLAIDKPQGMTSHDAVNRVRRLSGERRVGHAGTLDPAASGLLFVGVGPATRLSRYLSGAAKSYRARVVFGVATDTDDAQGRALGEASGGTAGLPAPSPAAVKALLDEGAARAALDAVKGPALQMPPAYSAIKKGGVTAYKAAREGKAIELEPRPVHVYEADLLGVGVGECSVADGQGGRIAAEMPWWDISFRVSKGTYIRAIARDLGVRCGCGAHLGALRRTAVGAFGVAGACTLDALEERVADGAGLPWVDPAAVLGFPVLELADADCAAVSNGAAIAAPALLGEAGGDVAAAPAGRGETGGGPVGGGLARESPRDAEPSFVSCVAGGRLLAVYERDGVLLRPATVVPGGVAGVV